METATQLLPTDQTELMVRPNKRWGVEDRQEVRNGRNVAVCSFMAIWLPSHKVLQSMNVFCFSHLETAFVCSIIGNTICPCNELSGCIPTIQLNTESELFAVMTNCYKQHSLLDQQDYFQEAFSCHRISHIGTLLSSAGAATECYIAAGRNDTKSHSEWFTDTKRKRMLVFQQSGKCC